MAKEPKINSVRLVKVDRYNYAVQKYREFKDKRFPDSEVRLGWDDVGYYGSNFYWAVKSALMQAVPENQGLVGEFEKAVEDIVEQTMNHVGYKKPVLVEEPVKEAATTEPVKRKRGRPPKKKE